MKKIISLILVIAIALLLVGCKEVVKTENEEVEVTVVDTYRRGAYTVRCGKTWVTHPAIYRITVLYDSVEYTISGSNTYHKFKDKIGDKAIGILEIRTYDDGSIRQDIIKLKSCEVNGNE